MCVSGRRERRGEHYQAHRGDVAGQGMCRQRGGTLSRIREPRDVLCETRATPLSGRGRRYGVREFVDRTSAGEASLDEEKQT